MYMRKKKVIFAPKIVVYYTNNYCPLKKKRENIHITKIIGFIVRANAR